MTTWDDPHYLFLDFDVRLLRHPLGSGIVAQAGLSVGSSLAGRELPPPPEELVRVDRLNEQFGEPPPYLYGRQLFEWLFDEEVRHTFLRIRQMAAHTNRRMRTRLVIEPDLASFHRFRWEAMVYRRDDWFWAIESAFARAPAVDLGGGRLTTDRPVRMLAAAVTPGSSWPGEWSSHQVIRAFEREVVRPLGPVIAFHRLPAGEVSLSRLAEACQSGERPHIVALFAMTEPGIEDPVLLFAGPDGSPTPIPWADVAAAICGSDGAAPAFVWVFTPCPSDGWNQAVLPPPYADRLLAAGCGAVLEIRGPIDRSMGLQFVETFIGHLGRTGMIDIATAAARAELRERAPDQWAWTYPVLTLKDTGCSQLFHLLPEEYESTLAELRQQYRTTR